MSLQAALVTDVPRQFIEDMAALHRNEDLPATDAKVFDLFRVWRLDSGSYEEIAEVRLHSHMPFQQGSGDHKS